METWREAGPKLNRQGAKRAKSPIFRSLATRRSSAAITTVTDGLETVWNLYAAESCRANEER